MPPEDHAPKKQTQHGERRPSDEQICCRICIEPLLGGFEVTYEKAQAFEGYPDGKYSKRPYGEIEQEVERRK
ncbi:MAG: hypothetical protein F9K29_03340 [Hyphomicrobiaceae bacterium]|nr:MAG: hypothetical protein F9K29_03340 [Hyphomicrobiaceae bacterium]